MRPTLDCEKYHELVSVLIERMKHDSIEIRSLLSVVLMVHSAYPDSGLLDKVQEARQSTLVKEMVENEFLPLATSMEAARATWTRNLIDDMLGVVPSRNRIQ